MIRRFRSSSLVLVGIAVLVLSDKVDAERFGAAAPLVEMLQALGGSLAVWGDQLFTSVLGQLAPAGLPIPPALLLGAGLGLVMDLLRSRAQRERTRRASQG